VGKDVVRSYREAQGVIEDIPTLNPRNKTAIAVLPGKLFWDAYTTQPGKVCREICVAAHTDSHCF